MKEGDEHPDYPDVRRVPVGKTFEPHPCVGCPVPHTPELDCTCGTGFVWYGEHMRVINLTIARSKHDQKKPLP